MNKDAPRLISNGPIRVWIVSATGFRQSRRSKSGIELLWRKLRKLSRPDVCVVTQERWDSDAEEMADYIVRNSTTATPAVFFTGYSYGVGNYFLALARALQERGIEIDTAVLCDGVKRFKLGKWFSISWFRDLFTIRVPSNVETVYAFHQREDRWLQGHQVVADKPTLTQIDMIELHSVDHCSIDESPSYHRVAVKEAEDVIASVRGYRSQLEHSTDAISAE